MNERMKDMPARARSFSLMVLALAAAFLTVATAPLPAMATDIRYVVNDRPITNYDIARRVALLKLMRRSGNLNQTATQELIDQTLRRDEIANSGISVTQDMIDRSYASFASSNSLTTAQLDQILAQAGVTKEHFQGFMAAQIGWGRLLQSRSRSTGGALSEQEVVQRILQQGGKKPSTTEYTLQQVIFVVPSGERSRLLGRRKQEAQAMRNRFNSCEGTIGLAKGILDVTVRNMGRVLEPELPSDWKDQITKTSAGNATAIRETDRGVEFIGVCSTRQVSDDHVAKLIFQSEGAADESIEKLSEKLTAELREKARIVER